MWIPEKKYYFVPVLALLGLILPVLFPVSDVLTYSRSPDFYLSTDRAFGENEIPHVSLEGGEGSYEFRVYEITNPVQYLVQKVKDRYVSETLDKARSNPVEVVLSTWSLFKEDLHDIARDELNPGTRTHIRKALGVPNSEIYHARKLMNPGILKHHKLLSTFYKSVSGENWGYYQIPVPVGSSGIYLVEAIKDKSSAYTILSKSKIGVITKQSENQTVVFAADSETGEPVSGAQYQIYDAASSRLLGGGEIDSSGSGEVKLNTPGKTLVIVKKGNDIAISDPDYFSRSFYAGKGVRAYIYTDRPVYRPGDTVQFKGILREFSIGYGTPSNKPISIQVTNWFGRTVVPSVSATPLNDQGTFSGSFALPAGDNIPTGPHMVLLTYDNKTYSGEFHVESYKKPPFKLSVDADHRNYIAGDSIKLRFDAHYFHGQPLANKSLSYRIFRKARYQSNPVGRIDFNSVRDYLGIEEISRSRDLIEEKSVKLDQGGIFETTLTYDSLDQDYDYTVVASVTSDETTISGSHTFSVNRSNLYIQLNQETSVSAPGEPVKIGIQLKEYNKTDGKDLAKLTVRGTLYKREFVNISKDAEKKKITSVSTTTVSNGGASLELGTHPSGHYHLEIDVYDKKGRKTTTRTAFWISDKEDAIQAAVVNLTMKPSKDIFKPGEFAAVLIVSPISDGNLFLTLEGKEVYRKELVKMKGNSYLFKVRVVPEIMPNFTLSAVQFYGGKVLKNEVKVVAPPLQKFINVQTTSAKPVYRPGETAKIAVTTKDYQNKPVSAEFSIGIVDESIYQIRSELNEPIQNFFYHPRRNNVNTTLSSSFNFFGYSEMRNLKLAMKDRPDYAAAMKGDHMEARKHFEDTAYWMARGKTDASGNASVSFQLPDNIGSYKVIVRAITKDTKVGEDRSLSFTAKQDLILRPGLPQFLYGGMSQTVAASLINTTQKQEEVTATLELKNAKMTAKPEKKISLGAGESKTIYFTINTGETSVSDHVELTFTMVSSKLTDRVVKSIPLKDYGVIGKKSEMIYLESDDSNKSYDFEFDSHMSNVRVDANLVVGGGDALKQSLSYLADYPYGCVEQTMSRFVPLIAASKIGYISEKLERELPAMVEKGLQKTASHQNNDGGFGWFTNNSSDPMMTAYVHYALGAGRKLGIPVPPDMLNRSRMFLYETIAKNQLNPMQRAYVLRALSESVRLEASLVNRMIKDLEKAPPYGKALGSIVLLNQGDPVKGKELYREALEDSGIIKSSFFWSDDDKKNQWQFDGVETTATLLIAAIRYEEDEDTIRKLEEELIRTRSGIAWKNSRDSAMAVLALAERYRSTTETGESVNAEVLINDKNIGSVALKPGGKSDRTTITSDENTGNLEVEIRKSGRMPLYASVVATYFEKRKMYEPVNEGIHSTRAYHKMITSNSGDSISLQEQKSNSFQIGDLVMVSIQIKPEQTNENYVMVEDFIPPGFSYESQDSQYYSDHRKIEYDFREVYDDRVVFFVTRPERDMTIRYFLRADLPGDYTVLPSASSLMYYPGVFGRTSSSYITVTGNNQ